MPTFRNTGCSETVACTRKLQMLMNYPEESIQLDFLCFKAWITALRPMQPSVKWQWVEGRGRALITHLHLLPRLGMSGTIPTLCHMHSWCRHIKFYLHLNLTLFSVWITNPCVNAKQRHSPQFSVWITNPCVNAKQRHSPQSTFCHPCKTMAAYQLAWER
jgi:hypothetical protein